MRSSMHAMPHGACVAQARYGQGTCTLQALCVHDAAGTVQDHAWRARNVISRAHALRMHCACHVYAWGVRRRRAQSAPSFSMSHWLHPPSRTPLAKACTPSGALNTDLSDITSNLVPFPRLHFLVPALAPLYATHHAGTRRPGSATADHNHGLVGRTLQAPGCATHARRVADSAQGSIGACCARA